MAVVTGLAQLLLGVALWTLAEYALHRVDMHGHGLWGRRAASRPRPTAREHLAHHATLDVPALTAGTWVGAAMVALVFVWGGHVLVAAGWMAAYVAYELIHRRIHTTWSGFPSDGWYRRTVRAHHLHHHLVDVRSDYGVTSPVWDVVFRSYQRPTPTPRPGPERTHGGPPAGSVRRRGRTGG